MGQAKPGGMVTDPVGGQHAPTPIRSTGAAPSRRLPDVTAAPVATRSPRSTDSRSRPLPSSGTREERSGMSGNLTVWSKRRGTINAQAGRPGSGSSSAAQPRSGRRLASRVVSRSSSRPRRCGLRSTHASAPTSSRPGERRRPSRRPSGRTPAVVAGDVRTADILEVGSRA
jgi:hypothetical protein